MPTQPEPETTQTPIETDAATDTPTQQAIDAALAKLRRTARQQKTHLYALSLGYFATTLLIPVLVFVLRKNGILETGEGKEFFRLALITPFIVFAAYSCLSKPTLDVAELTKLGGGKAISILLQARRHNIIKGDRLVIEEALAILLRRLKASDSASLSQRDRITMNRLLTDYVGGKGMPLPTPALCVSILKALEQVGDAGAIPTVQWVASTRTRRIALLQVQQAAIECLPMLQANCGNVEATKTLLRASQAETAAPNTLLRPASGTGTTDSQQLLRAATSENHLPPPVPLDSDAP